MGTATATATRPHTLLSGCHRATVRTLVTTRMNSTTGQINALACVLTLRTTCSPSDNSFREIAMNESCHVHAHGDGRTPCLGRAVARDLSDRTAAGFAPSG